MNVIRDYWGRLQPPAYTLTKADFSRIGVIPCISNQTYTQEFNAPNKISFSTNMYIDNELSDIYEKIEIGQFVEVENIGRFVITEVDLQSNGTKYEEKNVTALSLETLLAQKYLELFTINMGTVESIDMVQFYRESDPTHSLLNMVLEKLPDWSIDHVDLELTTMERSFEITRQDVYSFLTSDVSEAFGCIFEFDTFNQTISAYKEENVGKRTDIYVTYDNLLMSTNISCSTDDIKTSLTVTGADDLNLREVNMGFSAIYNLDFFHNLDYMSESLYDAYGKWMKKWNDNVATYNDLLLHYQQYYERINEVTNKRMPGQDGSTVWTEYGLVPLQEQLKTRENKLDVMMKAGMGEPTHKEYNTRYLPVYNEIQAIKAQITVVEEEISTLKSEQKVYGDQMSAIANDISMPNNFTPEQLKELTKFIKEEELSTDNYVVTDVMTDSERIDMLNDMLEFGRKELAKVSQPQLTFSANMMNLFAMKEFEGTYEDFDVGNYIGIILRDDYIVNVRLLTMEMDFLNPSDFSVTFGNIARVGKDVYMDITDAINLAASVATSVSFNSSHWNKANKEASEITKILADGLLDQGKYLTASGENSSMVIDNRGVFVNTDAGEYPDDSIFLGGGRILFTEDDWKTVSMSTGRANVTKVGSSATYDTDGKVASVTTTSTTSSEFGTFADFCIASYIGGAEITGSIISNGNGTFFVDRDGKMLAKNANIKGTIWAEKGYIGDGTNGFTIDNDSISNGKNSLNDTHAGVYIGTDGISLGESNAAYIRNDGTANFKKDGSNFGALSFNAGGGYNWGSLGGASYFSPNVGSPFGGTAVTHIESISASYIKAQYLDAMNANIGQLQADMVTANNLIATKASISDLNAATARIGTLEADNVTIKGNISANSGEISSLKSKMITTTNLKTTIANAGMITVSQLNLGGGNVGFKNISVNGESFTVLTVSY